MKTQIRPLMCWTGRFRIVIIDRWNKLPSEAWSGPTAHVEPVVKVLRKAKGQ
jgi:hypothetical protein